MKTRRCSHCAKEFDFNRGLRAHVDGYCSQRCQFKNFRKRTTKRRRPSHPGEVRRASHRIDEQNFYASPEWRRVRYLALRGNDGRCELCGVTGKDKRLHVDHIKPRSKYPELSLEVTNLQILCEDCNLGKGNIDKVDWRRRSTKGGSST